MYCGNNPLTFTDPTGLEGEATTQQSFTETLQTVGVGIGDAFQTDRTEYSDYWLLNGGIFLLNSSIQVKNKIGDGIEYALGIPKEIEESGGDVGYWGIDKINDTGNAIVLGTIDFLKRPLYQTAYDLITNPEKMESLAADMFLFEVGARLLMPKVSNAKVPYRAGEVGENGSKFLINGVEDSAALRQEIAEGAQWRSNKLNEHVWERHPGLAKNGENQLPNYLLYDQRARQTILNADIVIPRAKGDYLFLNSSNGWASGVQPGANSEWFLNSFRLQTLKP